MASSGEYEYDHDEYGDIDSSDSSEHSEQEAAGEIQELRPEQPWSLEPRVVRRVVVDPEPEEQPQPVSSLIMHHHLICSFFVQSCSFITISPHKTTAPTALYRSPMPVSQSSILQGL